MSSLLHAVYGILAGGGEENSKAQAWATCISDGGNLHAQSSERIEILLHEELNDLKFD
jgi:hypothetical protein